MTSATPNNNIKNFFAQNANALVSGAMAGFTCDLCVHPIDTVRTRLILETGKSQYRNTFHAFQSILSKEGVRALYRGAGIVWTFTIPGIISFHLYFFVDLFFNIQTNNQIFFEQKKTRTCDILYDLRNRKEEAGEIERSENTDAFRIGFRS